MILVGPFLLRIFCDSMSLNSHLFHHLNCDLHSHVHPGTCPEPLKAEALKWGSSSCLPKSPAPAQVWQNPNSSQGRWGQQDPAGTGPELAPVFFKRVPCLCHPVKHRYDLQHFRSLNWRSCHKTLPRCFHAGQCYFLP